MDKYIFWIKENKLATFTIVIFTFVVISLSFLYKTFFAHNGSPIYGERLQCEKSSSVTENNKKAWSDTIKKDTYVLEHSIEMSGCRINFFVKVKDEVSRKEAEQLVKTVVNGLDEGQRNAFDLQFYFTKAKEDKNFPMIAYRHYGDSTISWI